MTTYDLREHPELKSFLWHWQKDGVPPFAFVDWLIEHDCESQAQVVQFGVNRGFLYPARIFHWWTWNPSANDASREFQKILCYRINDDVWRKLKYYDVTDGINRRYGHINNCRGDNPDTYMDKCFVLAIVDMLYAAAESGVTDLYDPALINTFYRQTDRI